MGCNRMMDQQKKLSKMQKLILKTIYKDYKEHPMRKFWDDIKIKQDGHIQWKAENRWRIGKYGGMQRKKLSKTISYKMVNKRSRFDCAAEAHKNYNEYTQSIKNGNKDITGLLVASLIERSHKKKVLEWQKPAFRAAMSRSLRRLRDRGLVKTWVNIESGYAMFVALTATGEKIAKNL